MQPVMITAAMVGAEVTRDAQPNLPTTPQEIVAAAVECYEAGASIIHIHVRDAEGNATQDGNLFREVVEDIRARCDVITQVSTGGAIWMGADEREFFVGTCLTDGGHECAVKTFARSEGAPGSGAGGDPG